MDTFSQVTSLVVIDQRGNVLLQETGGGGWAGNGKLLSSPPGSPITVGGGLGGKDIVEVATGAHIPAANTQSLLCISPDTTWGLYYRESRIGQQPAMVIEAKALETGITVVDVLVPRTYISCDWTPDSSKAVLSPGGK